MKEEQTYELSFWIGSKWTWKFVKAVSIADAKTKAPTGARNVNAKLAKSSVAGGRFD